MSTVPSRFDRVRFRLTKQGAVLLLLTTGFTLGALNTGTNLLYFVTALSLNLFLLNALVAWSGLRGLVVGRRAPARVVQGESFEVHLEVRHAKARGRAFPFEVRERPPKKLVATRPRVLVVGLGAGEQACVGYVTACRRRGWHAWRGVELASLAPFGLLEFRMRVSLPWRVLVLPPVHTVNGRILQQQPVSAESAARRLVFTAELRDQFRSLREHRPGDDVRAIHWRATARRGAPVVKEFERTAPDSTLVLLDLVACDPEVQDAAVAAAASLHAALARGGERVALGVSAGEGASFLAAGTGEVAVRRAREILAQAGGGDESDLRSLALRVGGAAARARIFVISTREASRAQRAAREAFPRAQVHTVAEPDDLWRVCARPATAAGGAP
jgi:uncharacterized protein (DUF58 family)